MKLKYFYHLFIAVTCAGASASMGSVESASLTLETKIPLVDVHGRIDHLAIDLVRHRLFVAELGNDSVGVVDIESQKLVGTITGLHEPQGVGYVASTDTIYVANGGDGSVNLFRGADYVLAGKIDLGDDADNVRVDDVDRQVIVGYGSGGLAMIDFLDTKKTVKIQLQSHPEGFQVDPINHRVFANIPNRHEVVVADTHTNQITQQWSTKLRFSNYPMAVDAKSQRIFTVFRHPSELGVFDMKDGTPVTSAPTCGDSDDVFFDAARSVLYVSCGEGYIDVFSLRLNILNRIDHIKTISGARTALYVPELDRLYLAVRSTLSEPAAIWIYRPTTSVAK